MLLVPLQCLSDSFPDGITAATKSTHVKKKV
jgi:hypothetical protein